MKTTTITVSFDEEKLSALKLYLKQRGTQPEEELEKALETLYTKTVPVGVREFIEMRSGSTAPAPKARKPKPSPSSAVGIARSPGVAGQEPRLITKFKYLKPNARESVGGYARYIATREGVEKIDDSFKLEPASKKQEQLIQKLLHDFPDSREMLEYEDYKSSPTKGNASEFITRTLEDNAHEVMQTKTYADYIATRPRAQRFGTHTNLMFVYMVIHMTQSKHII